jgi:hypothetical protein
MGLSPQGKEKAMCIIHIRVQCSDRFSELLVGNVQDAELTVESIVGTALLEVFDTVYVEDVTLLTPQSTAIGKALPGPWKIDGSEEAKEE